MPKITIDRQINALQHYEAQKFYQAALTLKEHPPHYTNTPYLMMLAFSVELFLKSLDVGFEIDYPSELYDPENPTAHNPSVLVPPENIKYKHPIGHPLDEVFGKLPEDIQNKLREMAKEQYGLEIEKVLERHANLFMDARYLYPKNPTPKQKKQKESKPVGIIESELANIAKMLAELKIKSQPEKPTS